MLLLTDFIS